jgi:hypothetical protein
LMLLNYNLVIFLLAFVDVLIDLKPTIDSKQNVSC